MTRKLVWVAAAAAVIPTSAWAESTPIEIRNLVATDLFALADTAIAEKRTEDAEITFRALTDDPDVEVRTEARFRHAMLLGVLEKPRDAAVLLRTILDEKPDAPRVRLELARMLVRIGDERAARRELRSAQAAGLPEGVAQVVDQFANALRSMRPYGGSVELGFAPDSNINRATRADTLDTVIAPLELSDDAKAKSGVGFSIGAQAFVRYPLSEQLQLQARLTSRSSLYGDEQFNDVLGGAQFGVDYRLGNIRLSPSVGRNLRWFGKSLYAVTDTVSLNTQVPAGRKAQVEADVSSGRANYRLNDLQDGWVHEASLAYERSFDGTSGARVSISGQRQTARDPAYATTTGGLTLLGWKQLGRISLFATIAARHLEADERIFLYPERRREWFASANVGATFRQLTWQGFAPLIRLGYERNWSSLTLYDYDRISTTFGLTRAF